MTFRVILILGGILLVTACGPRDEDSHQMVEVYQADPQIRASRLQKCADHITSKIAFKTESDIEECRKALAADQNADLAEHEARQEVASHAAPASTAKPFESH